MQERPTSWPAPSGLMTTLFITTLPLPSSIIPGTMTLEADVRGGQAPSAAQHVAVGISAAFHVVEKQPHEVVR